MNRLARILVVIGLMLGVLTIADSPIDAQSGEGRQRCETTNVLLLMDMSKSLQKTDPDNLRIDGAKALVTSLSNTADASGATVNLSIAGFGEGAAVEANAELPKEKSKATDEIDKFVTRTEDFNTDYVLALRLAVTHFASLADSSATCNKVVWFTDGAYSIDELAAPGLGEYTTSREKATIQSQLGAQICGPLPDGSTQGNPVSEAVRAAGFSVQMIDLRVRGEVETPDARSDRDQTAPVINRLLAADASDPCRVLGSRVEASQASELEAEFFAQGQIALGYFELDCGLLASPGYPATMVNALAIQNSNSEEQTTLLLDGNKQDSREGFAFYSRSSGPASSGLITAQVGAGELKTCFADLQLSVKSQGEAAVFGKAELSYLNFQVFGRGDTADGAGVNEKFAKLTASIDGNPAMVKWDQPSRSWRVSIPGPRTTPPVVVVTARAEGWKGASLDPISPVVELRNEPSAPRVAWKGLTRVEGKATVSGELEVTPSSLNTGGEICLTFQESTSTPETLSVTLGETNPVCRSDDEPFGIPASLISTSSSNGTGEVTLPFTTTYKPAGSSSEIKIGDSQKVVFPPVELVKPADAKRVALISAALLILSVLLSMGILVALTNRALRLPDPTNFRAVSVPLEVEDGVIRRAAGSAIRPEDFALIQGDRGKYVLPNGVELRGRNTINPFTDLSANAVAQSGVIGVVPGLTRSVEPRVKIPSSFERLAVVALSSTGLAGVATLIAKKGASLPMVDGAIDDAIERVNTERASASNAARRSARSGAEAEESALFGNDGTSLRAPFTPTRAGASTPPSAPSSPSAPTHGSIPPPAPPSTPPPPPRRG